MKDVKPVPKENEIDPMEALLRQAEAARDKAIAQKELAVAERDFARKQYTDIGRLLRQEREIHVKEIRKASERYAKSVVAPVLWFAGFVLLAYLVNLLVDYSLVSPVLGKPFSYVCICICCLFFGVLVERVSVKFKRKNHHRKD